MDRRDFQGVTPYQTALRRLRPTFLVVGLFSAAVNLLMLTGPVYMLQIYDRVLSSRSVETLFGLFIVVVVLFTFLGIYDFLRRRLLSRAAYRLDALTGELAFRHTSGVARAGTSNPLHDLTTVRGFLTGAPALSLFDLPWIPIFLVVVFLIHPVLGWLTLGGSLLAVLIALLNERLTHASTKQALKLDACERGFVEASRRNGEMVRALGMQANVARRWRVLHGGVLATLQRGGDRSEGFSALSRAFRLALQSLLLTGGAYYTLHGQITAGSIVVVSILSGRALAPVDQAIGSWRAIVRAIEAHRTLRRTLRPHNQGPALTLPAPKGRLELENLSKYRPGTPERSDRTRILSRIGFSLEPGAGLGVIGNSAAGKSTLARLLVGIWQAEEGALRLDGGALDQWDPDALGRHIGYLPQVVDLLPGTVAQNIARFDPAATEDSVCAAARIAGVHEMVLALPDGYATWVGDVGQPLSGGQIQRLGLARALYGEPQLIVLDEPNAHLDSAGEDALTGAIRTLRARGATVVVMAHRPSALAALDQVLVLKQGHAAFFGNKDDFLKAAVRPMKPMEHSVRPTIVAGGRQ